MKTGSRCRWQSRRSAVSGCTYVTTTVLQPNDVGMWCQLADYVCCQVNTCVGRYVVYDDGNWAQVRHGLVVLRQGSRLFTNSRSNYKSTRRGVNGKEMPMQAYYRPRVLQQAEDPRISGQSTHEGGRAVSPTHRPPLLSRIYSWYYCHRVTAQLQLNKYYYYYYYYYFC